MQESPTALNATKEKVTARRGGLFEQSDQEKKKMRFCSVLDHPSNLQMSPLNNQTRCIHKALLYGGDSRLNICGANLHYSALWPYFKINFRVSGGANP